MFKRIFKTIFILNLIFSTFLTSHAAVTQVSDGSVFITKSEFKALLNDASERVEKLEIQADSKIDSLVSSFLARNNIWHPMKQTLSTNSEDITGELIPHSFTTSGSAGEAQGLVTIKEKKICIEKIRKSGMMIIHILYRAKDVNGAANSFRWGYVGSMQNSGNWTSDNGTEVVANFYEIEPGETIATALNTTAKEESHKKYVCLIGSASGAKREGGTSNYGHTTAFALSPIETLIPAYFFVTKNNTLVWDCKQLYKFSRTNHANPVCSDQNGGQNIYIHLDSPVVY